MFDVNKYYGPDQPTWNPRSEGYVASGNKFTSTPGGVFLFDDMLSAEHCADLIAQFEEQPVYPVGVNGYSNDMANAGSMRANAWAPGLAVKLNTVFDPMPGLLQGTGRDMFGSGIRIQSPFSTERTDYHRLGSTPWMRFMRYRHAGKHVPHYDAPYKNEDESYITLFSWIIYLNDVPEEAGGCFQFVNDGFPNTHPQDRPAGWNDDWFDMADPILITVSIHPRRGRMLVFPHWLCHQVGEYTGEQARYIIRGDLAYAIHK